MISPESQRTHLAHHPRHIAGDTMTAVWLALRDHGASTVPEIARRARIPAHAIGPALWQLCLMGAAAPVGRGLGRRYANARVAHQLNRVLTNSPMSETRTT